MVKLTYLISRVLFGLDFFKFSDPLCDVRVFGKKPSYSKSSNSKDLSSMNSIKHSFEQCKYFCWGTHTLCSLYLKTYCTTKNICTYNTSSCLIDCYSYGWLTYISTIKQYKSLGVISYQHIKGFKFHLKETKEEDRAQTSNGGPFEVHMLRFAASWPRGFLGSALLLLKEAQHIQHTSPRAKVRARTQWKMSMVWCAGDLKTKTWSLFSCSLPECWG